MIRSALRLRPEQGQARRRLLSEERRERRRRKVVVTGLGLVSPLGCGVETAWPRLCEGQTTAVALEEERFSKVASKVACLVPRGEARGQLDLEAEFSRGDQQRLSLAMMFGLLAARRPCRRLAGLPPPRSRGSGPGSVWAWAWWTWST